MKDPVLLPVRIIGDEILRQKAEPVAEIGPEIREFTRDLVHTMYLRDGVGLAAPQVGKSLRIFAADPWWGREERQKEPLVLINPVIEASSGESVNEEGCISIPGIYADVARPSSITISYTDLDGQRQKLDLEGFAAIVMQHEYDHLDGVLFTDKISPLTKLKLKRRIKDLEKKTVNGVNIRYEVDSDAESEPE